MGVQTFGACVICGALGWAPDNGNPLCARHGGHIGEMQSTLIQTEQKLAEALAMGIVLRAGLERAFIVFGRLGGNSLTAAADTEVPLHQIVREEWLAARDVLEPQPECSICRRRHGREVEHPCE